MELSEQVEAEFVRIMRSARAALQVDALAVTVLSDDAAKIVVSDSAEGFDVVETLITPLIESVLRTRRTAVHARAHEVSLILTPIGDDEVIGVLHGARKAARRFDGPEVANFEVVARELARVYREGGPRPLVPLDHDSLVDEFELEDVSSIVTGDIEPISQPIVLGEGAFLGFGEIVPTSLLSTEGVQELLANAITKSLHLTEAHVAALVLSREDPFHLLALGATGEAPDVPTGDLISTSVVRRVFETGLPLLTFDAKGFQDLSATSDSLVGMSVSTVMCVPLLTKGARAVSAIYCATFGIGGKFDAKALAGLMSEARRLTPLLDNLGQFKGCD